MIQTWALQEQVLSAAEHIFSLVFQVSRAKEKLIKCKKTKTKKPTTTKKASQALVVYAFNPSTWEAEAGVYLSSRSACLQSEFQAGLKLRDLPPKYWDQRHAPPLPIYE